ncbi:hypothetical protein [Hanstruepera flava]|uniref:hypothetical protein n=1 Tax=Hanstruepera flava TaxID=2930218 RepID=UPI00202900BA|nr:hypothetical protein [Hanstruepera flava]
MQIITKTLVFIIFLVTVQLNYAQEKNEDKIEALIEQKKIIKAEEKSRLKEAVEAINKRLDDGEITLEEAARRKNEQAEKHALNIENRLAIIDNRIALLERNEYVDFDTGANLEGFKIEIGKNEESDEYDMGSFYIGPDHKRRPRKYDRRTTSDLVFAIGFNNAIIEGQSLSDSPYKIGGSGFVELGWAWKTRVFKNSNALRFKYGVSFQWNKLDIKDNLYFVEDDDGNVSLEEFRVNVNKSKFRTTNLVIPVHFEFGPSKKIERDDYFRYSTYRKFKVGLGGYAGLNLQSQQKLKYSENGKKEKDKFRDYNTNAFVYGLSGYLAWGGIGIYCKYDLQPIFNNQAIDQNNISLGIRFDMD